MSQEELDRLDAAWKGGGLTEDEYREALSAEASRLHPEYEQCEIESMLLVQLKAEALEGTLVRETERPEPPDERGGFAGRTSGKTEPEEAGETPENTREARADADKEADTGIGGERQGKGKGRGGDGNGDGGQSGGRRRWWDTYMVVPGWALGLPDGTECSKSERQ